MPNPKKILELLFVILTILIYSYFCLDDHKYQTKSKMKSENIPKNNFQKIKNQTSDRLGGVRYLNSDSYFPQADQEDQGGVYNHQGYEMYPSLTTISPRPQIYRTINHRAGYTGYQGYQGHQNRPSYIQKLPITLIRTSEENYSDFSEEEIDDPIMPYAMYHTWNSRPAGGTSYKHRPIPEFGYITSLEDIGYSNRPFRPSAAVASSSSKIDFQKIGIIALVKIGLAKLKAFSFLKFLFLIILKLKLFLIAIFVKFFLFFKALKILKALLAPLYLLALLPLLLLLLPLLLLPLLAPLLLLLPVPTISPVNTQISNRPITTGIFGLPVQIPAGGPGPGPIPVPVGPILAGRVGILDLLKNKSDHPAEPITDILKQLLDESEDCIERIACQMATKRESKLFSPFLTWYLKKVKQIAQNERVTSYVKAYLNASRSYRKKDNEIERDAEEWCFRRHPCITNKNHTQRTY